MSSSLPALKSLFDIVSFPDMSSVCKLSGEIVSNIMSNIISFALASERASTRDAWNCLGHGHGTPTLLIEAASIPIITISFGSLGFKFNVFLVVKNKS